MGYICFSASLRKEYCLNWLWVQLQVGLDQILSRTDCSGLPDEFAFESCHMHGNSQGAYGILQSCLGWDSRH